MKHSLISLFIAAFIVGLPMGLALAANPHSGTPGRPDKSCEDPGAGGPLGAFAPGKSFTSNGTFNPEGNAAAHYAGNVDGSHPTLNGAAAQYDVACFQQFSKTLPTVP
jgi:hypothetical protein